MRLIDADKLKKEIKKYNYLLASKYGSIEDGIFTSSLFKIIDDLPTEKANNKGGSDNGNESTN